MLQMARTRKPAEDKKSKAILIRITEDQRETLSLAAKRVGLDLSTWLRSLGLSAAAQMGLFPGGKKRE